MGESVRRGRHGTPDRARRRRGPSEVADAVADTLPDVVAFTWYVPGESLRRNTSSYVATPSAPVVPVASAVRPPGVWIWNATLAPATGDDSDPTYAEMTTVLRLA